MDKHGALGLTHLHCGLQPPSPTSQSASEEKTKEKKKTTKNLKTDTGDSYSCFRFSPRRTWKKNIWKIITTGYHLINTLEFGKLEKQEKKQKKKRETETEKKRKEKNKKRKGGRGKRGKEGKRGGF